ncbi:MAG: glutathione binding-like protein [Gammaproteobacteria bacterium]
MIDLYYWTTPNGHKITIFLEEAELAYRLLPVHIGRGEQFAPDFLSVSPNNRIPAIVDRAPADGGAPVSVFESGAILLYLAEKTGRFLPRELRAKYQVIQWLMWQMGGLGPMLGQNHHFRGYAPEKIPYPIERYEKETRRLYAVLDNQLGGREYICGEYSVADMACYPWIVPHERQGIEIAAYPNVRRWMEKTAARPAVVRAYEKGRGLNTEQTVDEEAKKFLFGQTAPENPAGDIRGGGN